MQIYQVDIDLPVPKKVPKPHLGINFYSQLRSQEHLLEATKFTVTVFQLGIRHTNQNLKFR